MLDNTIIVTSGRQCKKVLNMVKYNPASKIIIKCGFNKSNWTEFKNDNSDAIYAITDSN